MYDSGMSAHLADCPDCGRPLEEDTYSVTVAGVDGEPVEHGGTGLFCTNTKCDNHLFALPIF